MVRHRIVARIIILITNIVPKDIDKIVNKIIFRAYSLCVRVLGNYKITVQWENCVISEQSKKLGELL